MPSFLRMSFAMARPPSEEELALPIWRKILTRSMGAMHVRETTPAKPPATKYSVGCVFSFGIAAGQAVRCRRRFRGGVGERERRRGLETDRSSDTAGDEAGPAVVPDRFNDILPDATGTSAPTSRCGPAAPGGR